MPIPPPSPPSGGHDLHVPDAPELLPYLPMLYVAWADGDLEPVEIRAICSRLGTTEGMDENCQQFLDGWLDPEDPPSATDLTTLLATIRTAAASMAVGERRSLADLGVELAAAAGHQTSVAERQALEAIETSLGISGREAVRRLLSPERAAPDPEGPSPAFDVAAMTRFLDGDQAAIRDKVRGILSRPEFSYRYDLSREGYREQVLDWAQALAVEGLGALSYPEEVGGEGDLGAFIAAFETVAFHDLSLLVKLGVQFGLFGGSILQLGTQRHQERYLPQVGTLELPGCFAMTETGHGSNVHDLETVARYESQTEEFVLHTPSPAARKDYIGNAALHGRLATVFAQLEIGSEHHGVHAFLVPIREEDGAVCAGVGIEDCGEKLGLNGIDNGRLWFDQVRIPRQNLLDRFAQVDADGTYRSPISSPTKRFFVMLGTLVGGRVSVALAGLSASKSALTIAIRYGARRRQFGPDGAAETVLLDYRTHQRRLMPRLATTYALDFALSHLAGQYVDSSSDDRRAVESLAAGLKSYSTWHATDTIQTCRETCGGQGYLAVNRFAALKADSDVFTTFEGDNTVLLQLQAKSLLTGYARQFGEMNVFGLAKYLAGQAATAVAELNPVVTRRTDEEHLRDREFQLAALEWREQHLLTSVARRMKKRLDDGMDSFDALVEVQDHVVALAKAHTERVVLEQFAAGIDGCEEPALKAMLGSLCDLYALHRIEADRGWFLEHGYIESAKSKAIRKLVTKLCFEARPQAVPLVDAFGIPDPVLAAPIAFLP
ncbi:MAG: acyl-CoA oxidase [Nitrospirae bacterium]|nr:acyl-CoA oxidase [Nitrospirota bacterium]